MRKFRILIVCPNPTGLALLTSMLKSLGYLIEEAATDRLAVRLMERNPINLVLASVDPGDAEALELLSYVRRKYPVIPVVLMFPRVHPERTKEALRLGAMAVLKYPVPAVELRAAVLQALEHCESQPQEIPASRRESLSEPSASPRPCLRRAPGSTRMYCRGSHQRPTLPDRRTGDRAGWGFPHDAASTHGNPVPQGSARGIRKTDHHPGPPRLQLEPPADRAGPGHQSHYAL